MLTGGEDVTHHNKGKKLPNRVILGEYWWAIVLLAIGLAATVICGIPILIKQAEFIRDFWHG